MGTVKAESMDPVLEFAPASLKEKKLVDQMRDVMRVSITGCAPSNPIAIG